MLILVLGDSLPVMFIGWEGVGLCSLPADRLLVRQGRQRATPAARRSSSTASATSASCSGCSCSSSTPARCNSAEITARGDAGRPLTQPLVAGPAGARSGSALFLFVGATGKSAQIPLYVWLPDAMAGPTPVSALIHAATMVTAGVYMVARMHVVYRAGAGGAGDRRRSSARSTALFAAIIGFAQNDIKKVLAYSTVSQLGFMFVGRRHRQLRRAAIFHLVTHAFFKAGLFLGAGSVMHGMEPAARRRRATSRRWAACARSMPHHARHVPRLLPRDRRHLPVRRASSRRTRSSPARCERSIRPGWPRVATARSCGRGLLVGRARHRVLHVRASTSWCSTGEYRGRPTSIKHHIHESPAGDDGRRCGSSRSARSLVGFLGVPDVVWHARTTCFGEWLDAGAAAAGARGVAAHEFVTCRAHRRSACRCAGIGLAWLLYGGGFSPARAAASSPAFPRLYKLVATSSASTRSTTSLVVRPLRWHRAAACGRSSTASSSTWCWSTASASSSAASAAVASACRTATCSATWSASRRRARSSSTSPPSSTSAGRQVRR